MVTAYKTALDTYVPSRTNLIKASARWGRREHEPLEQTLADHTAYIGNLLVATDQGVGQILRSAHRRLPDLKDVRSSEKRLLRRAMRAKDLNESVAMVDTTDTNDDVWQAMRAALDYKVYQRLAGARTEEATELVQDLASSDSAFLGLELAKSRHVLERAQAIKARNMLGAIELAEKWVTPPLSDAVQSAFDGRVWAEAQQSKTIDDAMWFIDVYVNREWAVNALKQELFNSESFNTVAGTFGTAATE